MTIDNNHLQAKSWLLRLTTIPAVAVMNWEEMWAWGDWRVLGQYQARVRSLNSHPPLHGGGGGNRTQTTQLWKITHQVCCNYVQIWELYKGRGDGETFDGIDRDVNYFFLQWQPSLQDKKLFNLFRSDMGHPLHKRSQWIANLSFIPGHCRNQSTLAVSKHRLGICF